MKDVLIILLIRGIINVTLFVKANASQIASLIEKHFAECEISSSEKKLFHTLKKNNRKQPREMFCKKCVLRNFTKFTGKNLCQGLFFSQGAGLRPSTLLKKRLCQRDFSVDFMKFLRTPFLQNTTGRLLLNKPKNKSSRNNCL